LGVVVVIVDLYRGMFLMGSSLQRHVFDGAIKNAAIKNACVSLLFLSHQMFGRFD
jgi:hypothetical protein